VRILALETSTEHCSAALWDDGSVDAEEACAGQRHTELLPGMVAALLARRGFAPRDLSAVAFGEGPGSFTGLRIACGYAQGLAFSAALPVVGVGTLLAMAAGAGARRVVCCIDARMSEVYHAAYEWTDDGWHVIFPPAACAPAAAPLPEGGDWLGCGNGFAVYGEVLRERYAGRLVGIEPARVPHAREVAEIAAARCRAGLVQRAQDAAPVYLREKVALRTDERGRP
jgi:tRNA threonylcarbamoyladenosine biosynthesis protein TsaB